MSKPRIVNWAATEPRRSWLICSLVALAIMLPLAKPGFILTMDMVFTPHLRAPDTLSSSYLFHTALAVAGSILPSDVIQKVLLFFLLVLAGVGMHRLALYAKPSAPMWAVYFAGVLYTVNPFTYSRFMAGQYAVLLGYALLPFFARALLVFLKKPPKLQQAALLAGIVLAISIVSIHTLGLVALFAIFAIGVAIWQHRHQRHYIGVRLRYGAAILVAVLLLSSYWLVPLIQGRGHTAELIGLFAAADRAAFATDGGVLSVLWLQGFWAEAQGLYILPQEQMPWLWLCAGLILWGVVGAGIYISWRTQRSVAICFLAPAVVAIILALGWLNEWLAMWLPFFNGYREPHKFIGLLALAYAYFGMVGVTTIAAWVKHKAPRIGYKSAIIVAVALPFMFTPTMVWGCNGQLQPRQYPPDWSSANNLLNADSDTFKVLFLPWHQYMDFSFTGRVIANPAATFFDKPVIVSANPEFANLGPQTNDTATLAIENQILPAAFERDDLGQQLAPFGVKYVLIAKEFDYEQYEFMDTQKDLALVLEMAKLRMYRNQQFAGGQ